MATKVRRLAVLGSTGSIGRQTLDVVRALPGHFKVVGLGAGKNLDARLDPADVEAALELIQDILK